MAISVLERRSDYEWVIPQTESMRVPAVIYASESLVNAMDAKVFEQARNVASLPGIVAASYAMPDAHWGYGFPIGGVAAFDPTAGGVVSAGGVGFDISCGVRTLRTGITRAQLEAGKERLANELSRAIPAGVGSTAAFRLAGSEMEAMLAGGARWAVENGFGRKEDLDPVEEHGCMAGADPSAVSERAKQRQRGEMGTLGSGNHYLEVQRVDKHYHPEAAAAFGLVEDEMVVSIHCGSRGLGHQIGTEFLREMAVAAAGFGIELPDRELACAPIESPLGQKYLGAMRAGINCALANRQILTQLTRKSFARVFPDARLELVYDVSHNTCKAEEHRIGDDRRCLFIHRKGATRAYGPGHPELPEGYRKVGQPVIIGGSMGTASYVLTGTSESEKRAFSSACHGAGRAMSRHAATRQWRGRQLIGELAARGIIVKSPSLRGVAEEAPGAYKDVDSVVEATDRAGLARKVARLEPVICIKG